jgi:hypothetical protein
MSIISTLDTILLSILPVFTELGGKLFIRPVIGWILCPARHTVTGLLPYADPDGRAALRRAIWLNRLFQTVPTKAQWKKLTMLLVQALERAA